jgi:hypothetical protein
MHIREHPQFGSPGTTVSFCRPPSQPTCAYTRPIPPTDVAQHESEGHEQHPPDGWVDDDTEEGEGQATHGILGTQRQHPAAGGGRQVGRGGRVSPTVAGLCGMPRPAPAP